MKFFHHLRPKPNQLPLLITAFFLVLIGPTLRASPQVSQPKYSYTGKLIVPRPNTIFSDSSEVLREGKTGSVHMGLGLLAFEATAGMYLDPMNMVELKYLKQKDYFSGTMTLGSVSFLHFFDNSIYNRFGWAWRQGSPTKIITITDQEKQEGIYDSGIDMGIGNRWQWDKLSFGVEWFAFYVPLVNREEQDTSYSMHMRFALVHVGLST